MRSSQFITFSAVLLLIAGMPKDAYSGCHDTDWCVNYDTNGEGNCCDVANWEKQGNWGLCKPTAKAEKCVSAAEEAKLPRTRYGCLTTEECHKGRPGEYPPAPLTCCDHRDYKFGRTPDGECYPKETAMYCDGQVS